MQDCRYFHLIAPQTTEVEKTKQYCDLLLLDVFSKYLRPKHFELAKDANWRAEFFPHIKIKHAPDCSIFSVTINLDGKFFYDPDSPIAR